MPNQSNREQYNSQLVYILTKILQENLTGKLVVSSIQETYNLYFKRGCFIYGTGGCDRVRLWYRKAGQYKNIWQKIKLTEVSGAEPWEYKILQYGYSHNQLSPSQIEAIITNSGREILFTLLSDTNYNNRWQNNNSIDNCIAPIDFKETIFAPVKKLLLQQQQLNLPYFLRPSFAPVRSNQGQFINIPVEITPLLNGKYSF